MVSSANRFGCLRVAGYSGVYAMTYTAAEMREMADAIEPHPKTRAGFMLDPDKARTSATMLRQAAEAMDATTKEGE